MPSIWRCCWRPRRSVRASRCDASSSTPMCCGRRVRSRSATSWRWRARAIRRTTARAARRAWRSCSPEPTSTSLSGVTRSSPGARMRRRAILPLPSGRGVPAWRATRSRDGAPTARRRMRCRWIRRRPSASTTIRSARFRSCPRRSAGATCPNASTPSFPRRPARRWARDGCTICASTPRRSPGARPSGSRRVWRARRAPPRRSARCAAASSAPTTRSPSRRARASWRRLPRARRIRTTRTR